MNVLTFPSFILQVPSKLEILPVQYLIFENIIFLEIFKRFELFGLVNKFICLMIQLIYGQKKAFILRYLKITVIMLTHIVLFSEMVHEKNYIKL